MKPNSFFIILIRVTLRFLKGSQRQLPLKIGRLGLKQATLRTETRQKCKIDHLAQPRFPISTTSKLGASNQWSNLMKKEKGEEVDTRKKGRYRQKHIPSQTNAPPLRLIHVATRHDTTWRDGERNRGKGKEENRGEVTRNKRERGCAGEHLFGIEINEK